MGRSAYDFDEHGLKNVRTYIRNFELPRPDPLNQKDMVFVLGKTPQFKFATNVNKSHANTLESRPEKWRYLENIWKLSLEVISPLKWTNSKLPNTPFMHELEAQAYPDPRYKPAAVLPPFYSHGPIAIENMLPWLNLVLTTATRILHLTQPRTVSFAFQPGGNIANDRHIFQYLIWSHNGLLNTHEPCWYSGSILVAYQPPFILTVTDLEEFVGCKSFPPFNSFTDSLPSKFRLWAKIWDTCQMVQCSWFILTTYTHWVFGAFSKGMRVSFVSPVVPYNQKQPTILEHVIFWLSSGVRLPGTFRLPQVDESVFAEFDIDMQPIAHTHRAPLSESFWLGMDLSPEPSAHVDLGSQLRGEGSLASCSAIPERSQSSATRGDILAWLSTSKNAKHRALDEDDLVNHAVPEFEFYESMEHKDELCGEWMIPA